MRFKIYCILMGVALGALSAAEARENRWYGWPKDRDADSTSPPLREVATKTRIIGLLDKEGRGCPPVPGWTAERLLDAALRSDSKCEFWQPGPEDRAVIHDLGLDRFCVYTAGQGQSFDKPKGLMAAQPDRMALSASANDLEATVWKPLAATFKSETGAEAALGSLGPPSVRLTFLDSQPSGDGVPGAPPTGSQHGYTLMHLAKELACRAPDRCAARIASRRALGYANFTPKFDPEKPLPPFQARDDQGGDVGTVSDLGTAILIEVLDWRHAGSPGHLILNLSLGWDGELFKDLEVSSASKLRPDVLYVYRAMRFAARNGVLLIAAAGNQRGGTPGSNWPLLPAAWEMRRPAWSPLFHWRRLVYSVGGVDWQGLPLPNSRNGGHPRRVAYGDHAVADRGQNQPTAIYTGSSVSAAVVSSIAAVVWHLRPELRPDQVMRLIDRSGETHPMRADFYPWRTVWPLYLLIPPPRLSQVSLCKAVERACGPGGARCPTVAPAPGSCRLAHRPSQLNGLPPPPTTPAFVAESLPPSSIAMCGPRKQFFRPDPDPEPGLGLTGARICPSAQFGSVTSQRWTFPQPDAVPCSGCSLEPPSRTAALPVETVAALAPPSDLPDSHDVYTLHLQISDDWRPPKLTDGILQPDATLDIDCFDGSAPRSRKTYRIHFDPQDHGLQPIPDISRDASLSGCRAQLNFVVKKSDGKMMSIQNPVVVAPEQP